MTVQNNETVELPDNLEIMHLIQRYMHTSFSCRDRIILRRNIRDYFKYLWSRHKNFISRSVFNKRRTSEIVQQKYEGIWDKMKWSELLPEHPREYLMQWMDRHYLGNVWVLSRVHLALLEKIIAHFKPERVLEVGSGRGLNLILLSERFPEIEFTGIELSESGVLWARKIDSAPMLPIELIQYAPFNGHIKRIPGRVRFIQGNATKLPFEDRYFDLVYTRQALEQMEPYRDQVFSEIHRVCSNIGVFIEAFRDWNDTGTRRNRIVAKGYFAARISDLPRYGFESILTRSNLPTKTYMNVGLAIARKKP